MELQQKPSEARPRTTTKPRKARRARMWETGRYPWSLFRVPENVNLNGDVMPHPKRTSAVFVVHGMGQPRWAQTAAGLRGGFEDALEIIREYWEKASRKNSGSSQGRVSVRPIELPAPYVWDGHWGDYPDIEKTFPQDWARFNEPQRDFFRQLWQKRTVSKSRTVAWFFRQQLRLLQWRVRREVGTLAWLLYFPLQIVMAATLVVGLIRHPIVLTSYLADVRLYFDPRGVVENAIVQNIDRRVGEQFLRLIGLDWNFRGLAAHDRVEASGRRIVFDRVVWVAHSLGTVVSYNVLSDLFHRAADLEANGDDEQRGGVKRFRSSLVRFVTMGSPLDKAAFLFPYESIKPWPDGNRRELLDNGETLQDGNGQARWEWWVNFYHVLDPVSGALSNPLICGRHAPSNIHIGLWKLPGWAHVAYWTDARALRFILTRTYGRRVLRDKEYPPQPAWRLTMYAALAYVVWAALLVFAALFVIAWIVSDTHTVAGALQTLGGWLDWIPFLGA